MLLMFFIAVIAGSLVTALLVNVLKKEVAAAPAGASETAAVHDIPQPNIEIKAESKKSEIPEIKKLTDIIDTDLIEPHLSGDTRDDIIDEMIQKLSRKGALHSESEFKQAIMNRELEGTTGARHQHRDPAREV
jgi:PTS system fructose-specific IIC component